MAATAAPQLITPGLIAEKLGVPIHRVTRILNTRSHIRPAAYAGNVRVYERDAIAQVRHELNAIEARRTEQAGDLTACGGAA